MLNSITLARRSTSLLIAVCAAVAWAGSAFAQAVVPPPPLVKTGGSPNIKVLSHLTQGGFAKSADVEMEQELSRPYVYTPGFTGYFFQIVSVKDPANPKVLYRFSIENPELHQGIGAMDGKYFKIRGRYYYAQSFQFAQGGADTDIGAIIFDVTGLPDATKVREVARIREPELPGGFHNIFAYKHSDGRSLLVTTLVANKAHIYDLEKIVSGAPASTWKIADVPNPQQPAQGGYHDFYVGYDVASKQDKLYGAGSGGFYVFDVTKPETPALLYSIVGAPGMQGGHTFTPTSDHKYVVTETEYQFAPLRLFDMRPALEGKTQNIRTPMSAWTADWQALSHNHEMRWPYVFVSAYEDGLQVFNMIDPKKPKTVGSYYTCECEHMTGFGGTPAEGYRGTSVMNGAFGIDVRNADGLIVITDMETGLWVFRMDGFNGWKGSDWNVPDVSSVQDWDNGPVPRGKPVT
jgi:hypothetical protein